MPEGPVGRHEIKTISYTTCKPFCNTFARIQAKVSGLPYLSRTKSATLAGQLVGASEDVTDSIQAIDDIDAGGTPTVADIEALCEAAREAKVAQVLANFAAIQAKVSGLPYLVRGLN